MAEPTKTTPKKEPKKLKPLQKLLEFQKEVGAITKDTQHPHFKCKYFDINKVLEMVKPLLSKHGLLIAQPLTNIDGKPALQTSLIDADSGEVVSCFGIPLIECAKPQDMGSCITYYRRYALQSLLCLQAEDDDAEKAMGRENTPTTTKKPAQANTGGDTAPRKVCPYCKEEHTGQYNKCIKCYTKERKGETLVKTKTVVDPDAPPFPDKE